VLSAYDFIQVVAIPWGKQWPTEGVVAAVVVETSVGVAEGTVVVEAEQDIKAATVEDTKAVIVEVEVASAVVVAGPNLSGYTGGLIDNQVCSDC
jgi:hypothetical protein